MCPPEVCQKGRNFGYDTFIEFVKFPPYSDAAQTVMSRFEGETETAGIFIQGSETMVFEPDSSEFDERARIVFSSNGWLLRELCQSFRERSVTDQYREHVQARLALCERDLTASQLEMCAPLSFIIQEFAGNTNCG